MTGSIKFADGFISADIANGKGRLVLDRPTRKNAISRAMWLAIPEAVAWLARGGARVIVLSGGGTADFSAGADISEFDAVRKDAGSARDYERSNCAAFAALRPGGELHAVAGGAGSLASVRDAARLVGVEVDGRNHYADAASTTRRLEAAGFVDVRCALEEEPVRFASREALARYLADAALAPYEHGAERAPLVAEALDEPVADFVRLTLTARRPALRG